MDAGRRMPKELQVRLIRNELQRLGIAPDLVDVEALVDASLTYPENRANVMQRLRGLIPESQWMEIMARSPAEAERFEREWRAAAERFERAGREVKDVETARNILHRVYEEGEDDELKEELFRHPEYLAEIIATNGDRALAEQALNDLVDRWEDLGIQVARNQRELEELRKEMERAGVSAEEYERLRQEYERLRQEYERLRQEYDRLRERTSLRPMPPEDIKSIRDEIEKIRLELEELRRSITAVGRVTRQAVQERAKRMEKERVKGEVEIPMVPREYFAPPAGSIVTQEEFARLVAPDGWIKTRCPFCGMLWYYPSAIVSTLTARLGNRTVGGFKLSSIIALCPAHRETIDASYSLFAYAVDLGVISTEDCVTFFNLNLNRLNAHRRGMI